MAFCKYRVVAEGRLWRRKVARGTDRVGDCGSNLSPNHAGSSNVFNNKEIHCSSAQGPEQPGPDQGH